MNKDEEARFHLLVCGEALEPLHQIKGNLFRVEADRAKRYGRTDLIAYKAQEIWQGIGEIQRKLEEIEGMLREMTKDPYR